jgi:signal peptidase I
MGFYGSGDDHRIADDPWAPWLIPLALLMATLIIVFFVTFNYTTVDGDSMKPMLLSQDRLLLTKSYTEPQRGDIIVFKLKEGPRYADVVKRVVGIPGDTVLTVGDLAWVNGKPETPDHLIEVSGDQSRVGPVTVPSGTVFVMGDNRAISLDSRYVGCISLADVKGRAVAVFSPITRVRRVP